MKRVFICSPYRGDRDRNDAYLAACMADSLVRGEAPFAPHAIYPRYLDDADPAQREAGISAGLAWLEYAQMVAIYDDLGVSDGMDREELEALAHMIEVEYRSLGAPWREA